jgi:hypothetical protein
MHFLVGKVIFSIFPSDFVVCNYFSSWEINWAIFSIPVMGFYTKLSYTVDGIIVTLSRKRFKSIFYSVFTSLLQLAPTTATAPVLPGPSGE